MEKLILDSSVLLKFLLDESDSKLTDKILDEYLIDKIQILEPKLWLFEAWNILPRKKEIKNPHDWIKFLQNLNFFEKELKEKEIELTLYLCKKYPKICFYDASYHAMAICENWTFITCDEKYFQQTKEEWNICLLKDLYNW